MANCVICNRPLKDPDSILRGMGPVCAGKYAAAIEQERATTGPIVTVNGQPLKHVIKHSPTGMEWGYGGSGPADLALSILADYLGEQEVVRRYIQPDGWKHNATPYAYRLYQVFKYDFVAGFDRDSWRLTGAEVAAWLRSQGVEAPERDVVYEGRRAS